MKLGNPLYINWVYDKFPLLVAGRDSEYLQF